MASGLRVNIAGWCGHCCQQGGLPAAADGGPVLCILSMLVQHDSACVCVCVCRQPVGGGLQWHGVRSAVCALQHSTLVPLLQSASRALPRAACNQSGVGFREPSPCCCEALPCWSRADVTVLARQIYSRDHHFRVRFVYRVMSVPWHDSRSSTPTHSTEPRCVCACAGLVLRLSALSVHSSGNCRVLLGAPCPGCCFAAALRPCFCASLCEFAPSATVCACCCTTSIPPLQCC